MSGEITSFLLKLHELRSSVNLDEFKNEIKKLPMFNRVVEEVLERSRKHGKKVGIESLREKEIESKLDDRAKKWRRFFRDGDFVTIEQQRLFADFAELLTGESIAKHMKAIKPAKLTFPADVSIVPIRNDNKHSYSLGLPIINLTSGCVFMTSSGKFGNMMDTNIETYRLSSKDETESLIGDIFYRHSGASEDLVFGVIREEENE